MEQMLLSASIISGRADWESGIGVTCWHQQSSDLAARRCAGAAAAIPARQGAGTCTASLDYSQINTWRRLLRQTGGCAAENLRTTASQGLLISRKLQSAAHQVFSTSQTMLDLILFYRNDLGKQPAPDKMQKPRNLPLQQRTALSPKLFCKNKALCEV